MHVLLITGTMNRGGAETLIMELYRHIDRTKIQFDFWCYGNSEGAFDEEIKELGGKVWRAKQRFFKNPLLYLVEFYLFLQEHTEYKIIHSHLSDMSGFLMLIARLSRKRYRIAHSHIAYVGTNLRHRNLMRRCTWAVGRWFVRKNSNAIIGCSRPAIEYLAGMNFKGETFLLRNAIDVGKYQFSEDKRVRAREQLKVEPNELLVGNVSRFYYPKNHEWQISVFCELQKRITHSRLVLIGDGSTQQEIRNLVRKLELEGKVLFLGVREDIPALMCAMDVFLFPSRYEGFGIAAIEAQASGLPTVVSDRVPFETKTTNLITYISLEETVETWAYILEKKAVRRRESARKEYADIVRENGFDISETATWLENYYQSIGYDP